MRNPERRRIGGLSRVRWRSDLGFEETRWSIGRMLKPRRPALLRSRIALSARSNRCPAVLQVGVPGVIRTRDPRFHPTSAFAAAMWRSWSGLSLRRSLEKGLRRRPSSLYTFLLSKAWLGIGMAPGAETFPDFERIHGGVSGLSAQF